MRALLDLLVGESAERVLDHDGVKIAHAERVALHLRLVQELRGDDNCRGAAGGFQSDAVMRTARRAGPSVADRRQDNIVIVRDGLDQCWISFLGEAFLAVVIHCGKGEFFLEPRCGLA